jgi:hypothetical protein
MRYLPLLLLVACSSTSAPRTMGSAPEPVTITDTCSAACQHRKDMCHMLPTVDQCAVACRAGGSPASCWAAATTPAAMVACDKTIRCQ